MSTEIANSLIGEIATRARTQPSAVGLDTHLVAELGMSSLDVLAVLAFAEKRYGVLFPDSGLLELSSVNKIVAAILALQGKT